MPRVSGERQGPDFLGQIPALLFLSFLTLDKFISFPDLSVLLRKGGEGPFQHLHEDKCPPGAQHRALTPFFSPQVPQRTSSIATALNTSGAGGSRPAQAVRAR